MQPRSSSAPGVGDCPDDNVLAEYVQGALSPEHQQWMEAHLDQCHRCASALHLLAHLTEAGDDAPARAPDAAAPAHIGRYELRGTLGTGGMGVVHLAWDPQLGREVALKVMRPDLFVSAGGGDLRRRFDREAKVLARLSHPNVVAVYDAGEAPEGVYIAMEYVDGAPLSRWLTEHQPTRWQIIDVFLQAGRGLEAAHALGLIHRDVKPDNILVGRDGRARISDFGLAVPVATDGATQTAPGEPLSRITRAGQLVGTPAYMPPEQLAGATVDHRSDQYAFCATLYEALVGRQVTDREQWVAAALEGRRDLDGAQQRLPLPVRRVLHRGLRSDPAERYDALGPLLEDLAPATDPQRWVVQRSRRWAWAVLGAVAVLSLVLGLWLGRDDEPSSAKTPVSAADAGVERVRHAMTPDDRRAPPRRVGPRRLATPVDTQSPAPRKTGLPRMTIYRSRPGRFRVWLPGTPTARVFNNPTPVGNLDFHTITATHASHGCKAPVGCVFNVSYADFPKKALLRTWPGQILDKTRASIIRLSKGKLLDERIATLDGYPARLYTLSRPKLGRTPAMVLRVLLVFVKGRLYQVQAITAPGSENIRLVAEVLETFQLWEPPPLPRPRP